MNGTFADGGEDAAMTAGRETGATAEQLICYLSSNNGRSTQGGIESRGVDRYGGVNCARSPGIAGSAAAASQPTGTRRGGTGAYRHQQRTHRRRSGPESAGRSPVF